jgi:hypothetical protein
VHDRLRRPDGYLFVPRPCWHLAIAGGLYLTAWFVWATLGWFALAQNTNCGLSGLTLGCFLAMGAFFTLYYMWWLALPVIGLCSALVVGALLQRGERARLAFGISLTLVLLVAGAGLHLATWIIAVGVPAPFSHGIHRQAAFWSALSAFLAVVGFVLLRRKRAQGRILALVVVAIWAAMTATQHSQASWVLEMPLRILLLAGQAALFVYLALPSTARALAGAHEA